MPEHNSTSPETAANPQVKGLKKKSLTEIFMLIVQAKEHLEIACNGSREQPNNSVQAARNILNDAVGKALIYSNS